MGGMQVLEWAATYPDAVFAAVPIAAAVLPFGAEHRLPRGRPAGDLRRSRTGRAAATGGPAASRRAASRWRACARTSPICREQALTRKFGRRLQAAPQGGRARRSACSATCSRWKATCATRAAPSSAASTPTPTSPITRAMDYFDLAAEHGGDLAARVPRHPHAVLHRLVQLRLAVPDRGEPRRRARAEPARRPT